MHIMKEIPVWTSGSNVHASLPVYKLDIFNRATASLVKIRGTCPSETIHTIFSFVNFINLK